MTNSSCLMSVFQSQSIAQSVKRQHKKVKMEENNNKRQVADAQHGRRL
jgi:hypothetical protein